MTVMASLDAQPDAMRQVDARVVVDAMVGATPHAPCCGDATGRGTAQITTHVECSGLCPRFFCGMPQQRPNVGRCQEGDGCRPGVQGDCPPERPYCHLKGGATVCTAAGELGRGQDCVDDFDIPRPCQEGLVCNNSVCQVPCVPGEANECPEDGRCIDISARTGVESGLCGPRNCNWFTGEGCGPTRNAVTRSVPMGSCWLVYGAHGPGNANGAPCGRNRS